MRPPSLTIGFLALLLSRAAAAADGPALSGPEVALRLGVAFPTGESQNGTSLSSGISNTVPLIFEGGYRVDPSLFLGARFEYAFASFKHTNGGTCSGNGASCGGSDTALGLEGIYRLQPEAVFAPWIGLGGGYEWLSEDVSSTNFNASGNITVHSWQAILEIGGDVRVTPQLVLGPFVEAQAGKYYEGNTSAAFGNATTGGDFTINNTAWHTWIVIGVRGAFGF